MTETAAVLRGKLIGEQALQYHQISIDTRTLSNPPDTLFFALKGKNHDGHKYIDEAYQAGVRCFVTDEPIDTSKYPGAAFIQTEDSLESLQKLAAAHRRKFPVPVIGITGSNGKTVVKEWIFQLLRNDYNVVRSPRSYNSQVGVPLSVMQMQKEHTLAIFEAGVSQTGEMKKLKSIIEPTLGIFTHLGDAHQTNFLSLEQKAVEKAWLFADCELVIYCRDQKIIGKAIRNLGVKTFTWTLREDSGADLKVKILERANGNTRIAFYFQDTVFNAILPFGDDASIENACHTVALLCYLGYQGEEIARRLVQLSPVAMRLEQKQGIEHCTLINDTYNSDLGSLTIALNMLSGQHQNSAKTLILSDILQTTRKPTALYVEVDRMLREHRINRLIGIGPEISHHASVFATPQKSFFPDTETFLAHIPEFHDEAILIKGSRDFRFERIVSLLEDKAHQTVLEINLDAFSRNLSYFRSLLHQNTKMVTMVKAFSYGSGSFEIANLLEHHRIDYLAVAFSDEGKTLREKGIRIPIIVMNPEPSSYPTIIKYQLEPEIYHFAPLLRFSAAVKNQGLNHYPIHLKIDTGMHRLGFVEEELNSLTESLLQHREYLRVASVFSHLAAADDPDFDSFTLSQLNAFARMSEQIIKTAGDANTLRHILNSAGIERFPEYQFDMVRLGIGLYGISAVGSPALQQVSSLKSIILQIKNIRAGESVGYGRKHMAIKDQTIGTVPIGYADGLRRSLGNGIGRVMIHDRYAPIIGNICMDMCMIDLTGIPASEGDPVLFFGPEYPVTAMADQLGTIAYEVLTGISPRVKRIYFRE
ncbi:MAG: bifunctional UDP-N-acetylmuramoyl-tripeptide:D-alanyl-D-alanine ligase/alanine racemase [Bacteroidales bacterium]|nr:bifunctional UDP-N-acetylmuramoyl-tripeptide:D-alanyl-D-alanine ligase/alanine racemase [Bacteroidales bacterium]